ncbi:MAG: threonine synthase [Clostridia bacterium]|nr:threonine synthase [Clostridia bacterium]
MMRYISTRGETTEYSASQGIIRGLARDKGLLVPNSLPEKLDLNELWDKNYKYIAKTVLSKFFEDFTPQEISYCVESAYDDKFDTKEIAPLVWANNVYFLELYHGKTAAFKDMALSILPHLLTTSLKKEDERSKICILTATSGDTGKAALEGFKDVEGTEIVVFYPEDGVSQVQKQQMITQEGDNTHVFAIKGNFDDAQTAVKEIFNDDYFNDTLRERGVKLSSANSINIGRLVPQVAYYVHAYCQLVQKGKITLGDPINVVVPTGNFGNILASYYAKLIGVPINKFICASNENKVLTDFFRTGIYDTRRRFRLTNSPSMDILVSSNLERLLYILSDGDTEKVASMMKSLDEKKYFTVDGDIARGFQDFYAGYATVKQTNAAIKEMYDKQRYLMDTHTAVAYKVYCDYVEKTGDDTTTVIASTASCYKFAESVCKSIGFDEKENGFEYIKQLNQRTRLPIPEGLRDLDKKKIYHFDAIDKDLMRRAIKNSCL